MSEERIKIITNLFVQALKTKYESKLDKVILYGSYAREEQTENSDIDLLVLLEISENELSEVRNTMRPYVNDLDWEYDVLLSPVYQSCWNYQHYMEASGFYQNIDREGILVG